MVISCHFPTQSDNYYVLFGWCVPTRGDPPDKYPDKLCPMNMIIPPPVSSQGVLGEAAGGSVVTELSVTVRSLQLLLIGRPV